MTGLFITFEGGEGSGKSTQATRLGERLKGMGLDVVVTREPGGTPEAEALRGLLVSGDVTRWTPAAEALLNYAARDSHLARVVRPALARGAVVLCDRFMDSTRAYQGYAGGVSLEFLDSLERHIVGATRPDLTLIFDLDPREGLARATSRAGFEDRFERKGLDFHARLRDGFLDILRRDPKRCRLVDGAEAAEQVADAVWSIVSRIV